MNDHDRLAIGTTPLSPDVCFDFVRRMNLWSSLLRRQQEEYIASLVPIDNVWVDQECEKILGGQNLSSFLDKLLLTHDEWRSDIYRAEALRRFSEAHFGPGLEEEFLSSNGGHDQIIYSILPSKDQGLIHELWIRLEEGEALFSELATIYGEGPEAKRKGIIGPLPFGNIQPPQIASILRTLQPGEIHSPIILGDWHILLRLESIQPARLDDSMRTHLLSIQMDDFINSRVELLLSGNQPDDLVFNK